ncbi:MAG: S1C family serine protease [Patescibacteria group bacterium]|jgi:serine protease Do
MSTTVSPTKNIILLMFLSLLLIVSGLVGGAIGGYYGDEIIGKYFSSVAKDKNTEAEGAVLVEQKIVSEESLVIDVVKNASPSVVTVGIQKTQRILRGNPFGNLFDPFGFFGQQQNPQIEEQEIEQDIGTGFVLTDDGLIVTNKHVVADTDAEYKVISVDNKEYKVENIYRDPTLDLAILKIAGSDLKPLPLGNSDNLEVGQFVVAIGTALGEFRNTVTTGVISGLGRGIVAGDVFGASSERLENVIQTDAAINPGNSGGPLLNSLGQVIGVNVATAGGADNISFAIPINVVKQSIDNFNQTGRFERAYLGVQYKMISKDLALLNEVPEGAYLVTVIEGSPAAKAGLENGDIIMKLDGQSLGDVEGGLAKIIGQKKIGDTIEIEYWRNGEKKTATAILEETAQ